jgi:hypothetical protein
MKTKTMNLELARVEQQPELRSMSLGLVVFYSKDVGRLL